MRSRFNIPGHLFWGSLCWPKKVAKEVCHRVLPNVVEPLSAEIREGDIEISKQIFIEDSCTAHLGDTCQATGETGLVAKM